MARFDRVIPPGGEGKITLKADTRGYLGQVNWQARIYTNDTSNPVETIALTGHLRMAVSVWPSIAFLKGSKNEVVMQSVQVEGKLNKPLKVEPLEFNLADHVKYKIVELDAGKVFQVQLTSIPGSGSKYRGFLKLKTGYEEKPEIVIPIWGDFGY